MKETQHDRKKNTILKTLLIFTAVFSLSSGLASCKGIELENKTEQVEEYTKAQAMVLIANERNRYENIFTDSVWSIKVSDDGTGLDKLTIQNVKQLMEQLKLLTMLAEERGITVASHERDQIRQLTDEYMAGLTAGDLEYMECDRADVQAVYTDYYTADKLIKSISGAMRSDISDSEAKVIQIQQIATADLKKAKAILKRLKIDGAEFNSMASRYTEADEINRTLMRGASEGLIERTAFGLEEGQISNILCIDGMYYIVKCTDGYDEEATRSRKNRLELALNTKAVQDVLLPYQEEHKILFVSRFWNELDFTEPEESTTDCFFDLYDEFFS